ncbi:MAG: glycosyltransferase [Myxococcales bacterium]|nr:glycosyltransferase [Myxococcales bacterium]
MQELVSEAAKDRAAPAPDGAPSASAQPASEPGTPREPGEPRTPREPGEPRTPREPSAPRAPAVIAVLIPCYNEAVAIASVIADFRAALPTATVYVYDNRSTDRTAEVARAAGAIVRREERPGKGNVVRRMFQDIEADVYLMVDGDDTYQAAQAPRMIERLLDDRLDMVVGRRVEIHQDAYRGGHRLGNRLLTGLVGALFGSQLADMLSGYRVFSRRFVKSFPSSSREFEIETELTVHAMQMRMACAEIDTPYKERPSGSVSKLRTFRDGWRILLAITNLVRNERPLMFFAAIAALLWIVAAALGAPVVLHWLDTGKVPRFPTAILASAIVVVGVIALATGLILDLVAHVRREVRLLAYLSQPATPPRDPAPPSTPAPHS